MVQFLWLLLLGHPDLGFQPSKLEHALAETKIGVQDEERWKVWKGQDWNQSTWEGKGRQERAAIASGIPALHCWHGTLDRCALDQQHAYYKTTPGTSQQSSREEGTGRRTRREQCRSSRASKKLVGQSTDPRGAEDSPSQIHLKGGSDLWGRYTVETSESNNHQAPWRIDAAGKSMDGIPEVEQVELGLPEGNILAEESREAQGTQGCPREAGCFTESTSREDDSGRRGGRRKSPRQRRVHGSATSSAMGHLRRRTRVRRSGQERCSITLWQTTQEAKGQRHKMNEHQQKEGNRTRRKRDRAKHITRQDERTNCDEQCPKHPKHTCRFQAPHCLWLQGNPENRANASQAAPMTHFEISRQQLCMQTATGETQYHNSSKLCDASMGGENQEPMKSTVATTIMLAFFQVELQAVMAGLFLMLGLVVVSCLLITAGWKFKFWQMMTPRKLHEGQRTGKMVKVNEERRNARGRWRTTNSMQMPCLLLYFLISPTLDIPSGAQARSWQSNHHQDEYNIFEGERHDFGKHQDNPHNFDQSAYSPSQPKHQGRQRQSSEINESSNGKTMNDKTQGSMLCSTEEPTQHDDNTQALDRLSDEPELGESHGTKRGDLAGDKSSSSS